MFKTKFTESRPLLIPFLMAGFPDLETSERLAIAAIESGADALELGVPFSDPLADGPVIQAAAEKALSHGIRLKDVLALAGRLTKRFPDFPIVIFSYLNPLLRYGLEPYARDARANGTAATLIVDIPPEEAEGAIKAHRAAGLGTVYLASPTTAQDRLRLIADSSTEFIYYVSRTGVTGESATLSQSLREELGRIRSVTDRPIAVGFGISTPEHVKSVAEIADGIVIGSAFIRLIAEAPTPQEAEARVRAFTRACADARDSVRGRAR